MIVMPKKPKNTSLGTVAIATLVGGVAGAFTSLMLTPKSGKELRQDIHSKVESIIEQVEETAFQGVEVINQRRTELSVKGKILKEDIQIFIKDLKQKRPSYIEITQSTTEETSPQPAAEPEPEPEPEPELKLESELKPELKLEPEPDSSEFVPTEIPTHEGTPTVYL